MSQWLMTGGLVALAYWLGFRHGQIHYERVIKRILNKIAYKMGVPLEHDFWESRHEWQQAVRDIKAELERQVKDE